MALLSAAATTSYLRGVAAILEQNEFRLLGAHEVAPQILMVEGTIGRHQPSGRDQTDIARGLALLAALGPFDVGQAVVVADGHVLAVEAAEGTDRMLERIVSLRREGRIHSPPGLGVLVKAPKPGQDRRFDLPAVGHIDGRRRGARGISRRCGCCRQCSDCRARARRPTRRCRECVRGRRPRSRSMTAVAPSDVLKVFVVACEESGDRLGGALMRALRAGAGRPVEFAGVGGDAMAAQGLQTLFPIGEMAIIGLNGVLTRLPMLLRRMRETTRAVMAQRPRRAGHHRQSGLHPSCRASGAGARARCPYRRLCIALGMGVASRTRAGDAPLYRSRTGIVAVRACKCTPGWAVRRAPMWVTRCPKW